jgi:GNAT superfamily N-acetyltransferase
MENESNEVLPVTIRLIAPGDEAQWRGLWAAYCEFYETEVPEATTAFLWKRLAQGDDIVFGLVAVEGERLLGFAHGVLHPHTWSDKTLCYLEDLFVTSELRGKRIGQRLIDRLIEMGRENNWKRVYWHTNQDNATARRLYDHYTAADPYVRYTVSL